MSDPWGPSASPPPPSFKPADQARRSGAFRDTLIVAGVSALGVVGLILWSGGDAPAGAELDESAPTVPPGVSLPPGVTLPPALTSPGISDGAGGTVAATATVQGAAPGDPAAQLALPSDPAAYEGMVAVRDAFIAALPVPTGGAEQPPDGAGVRTWLFSGTGWETIRNDYLGFLQAQGFVATLSQSVNEGGAVGELYVLSDPTGTVYVQLAVASQGGQSVIEVTRQ